MCLISITGSKPVNDVEVEIEFKEKSQYSLPFTMIHGDIYDLTEFKHPGGKVAIELAYGRDATEMFESMHALCDKKKLSAILQKYKVITKGRQDIVKTYIQPSGVFDWKETLESNFTKELQDFAKMTLKAGDKINTTKFFEIGIKCYLFLLQ